MYSIPLHTRYLFQTGFEHWPVENVASKADPHAHATQGKPQYRKLHTTLGRPGFIENAATADGRIWTELLGKKMGVYQILTLG
jgi:hypothetical protein